MTRDMPDNAALVRADARDEAARSADEAARVELDRRIVLATQGGLPLVARPYAAVAETLGVAEGLVREAWMVLHSAHAYETWLGMARKIL